MNARKPKSVNQILFSQKKEIFGSDLRKKQKKALAEKLYKNQGIAKVKRLDFLCDLFLWNGTEIVHIGTMSNRRAKTLTKAIKEGTIKNVPQAIINNYCNNGYTTRGGLFRSGKKENRCQKISISHQECQLRGKEGHDIRIKLRNEI